MLLEEKQSQNETILSLKEEVQRLHNKLKEITKEKDDTQNEL